MKKLFTGLLAVSLPVLLFTFCVTWSILAVTYYEAENKRPQRVEASSINSANINTQVGRLIPVPARWNENEQVLKFSAGKSLTEMYAARQAELVSYLNSKKISDNYSIYFEDLKSGDKVLHLEGRNRKPASIYKVALAVLVMRRSETSGLSLNKLVRIENKNYSLAKVMELMLTESNNDAISIMERELGGYNATQSLIGQEFGAVLKRAGQITTATDIAKVYKKLYESYIQDGGYLNRTSAVQIIDLMKRQIPQLQDRIPAAVRAVKPDYEIASKIGTLDGVYQDAALIFTDSGRDYLLVILNEQRLTTSAVAEIREITRILLY